jgi:hypothetical protein
METKINYMEQGPLWEANSFPASQEISPFYWTRNFITATCLYPELHKPSPGFPFPLLKYQF